MTHPKNPQSQADKAISLLDRIAEYRVFLSIASFVLYLDVASVTSSGTNLLGFDHVITPGTDAPSGISFAVIIILLALYSLLTSFVMPIVRHLTEFAINLVWGSQWAFTIRYHLRNKNAYRYDPCPEHGYVLIQDLEKGAFQETDSFAMGIAKERRQAVARERNNLDALAFKSFCGIVLLLIDCFMIGSGSITAQAMLAIDASVHPTLAHYADLLQGFAFVAVGMPWFYLMFVHDDQFQSWVEYPPLAAKIVAERRVQKEEQRRFEAEARRRQEERARQKMRRGIDDDDSWEESPEF